MAKKDRAREHRSVEKVRGQDLWNHISVSERCSPTLSLMSDAWAKEICSHRDAYMSGALMSLWERDMCVRPRVSRSCVGHDRLCVSEYHNNVCVWERYVPKQRYTHVRNNHVSVNEWFSLTKTCAFARHNHISVSERYALTHSFSCPTHERETLGLTYINKCQEQ